MKDHTQDKKVAQPGPYQLIYEEFKREMENQVVIPILQGRANIQVLIHMFGRFGKWESFCEEMDTMLNEEAFYRMLNEELEDEKEELRVKYNSLIEDLRGLSCDLEGIPYQGNEEFDTPVQDAIKKLNEAIGGEIKTIRKRKKK